MAKYHNNSEEHIYQHGQAFSTQVTWQLFGKVFFIVSCPDVLTLDFSRLADKLPHHRLPRIDYRDNTTICFPLARAFVRSDSRTVVPFLLTLH